MGAGNVTLQDPVNLAHFHTRIIDMHIGKSLNMCPSTKGCSSRIHAATFTTHAVAVRDDVMTWEDVA